MRLAVETEMFFNYGIQAAAILFQRLLCGTDASVQIDDAFQRGVGLQADDYFIFFIDITGGKIIDTGDGPCLHADDAFLYLFNNQGMGFFPDLFRALGCGGKKTGVTGIGRVVFLDKIAYIYKMAPFPGAESFPGFVVAIDRHNESSIYYSDGPGSSRGS